ncbi:chemotaxis protein CheD [Fulvimarina endophytica]|uniref:Probable chemoreceptor glutamine deamidase CheD n=1 Tax=Fulvimarina endophytica TaxID=2293836 RepID=A0A371X812_9HYPH|nr:chemotaxis protein CheD [Fulvimarina endophytica]RFC65373.1 chemotaxis protein CheD [Fulvimarina endophytica]
MTMRDDPYKRINLIQGEAVVTDEDVVIATMLGSCVAACIRDPIAGVGGVNHFLLPGSDSGAQRGRAESYGVYLMELLINGILKKGGDRRRMEAKLFGGARTINSLQDIGGRNADFARNFLQNESIRCVAEDLGGTRGRCIQYWPMSGRTRRKLMDDSTLFKPVPVMPSLAKAAHGEIELF